ncbi:MAG: hypothetical protein GXO27_04795 [Chlorobi bacterium]|nr:hypothetical protein [Chlorobiota bacterium]
MVPLINLQYLTDLVNCEGRIVGLYRTPEGEPILEILTADRNGYIILDPPETHLKAYLDGEMTLHELYRLTPGHIVFRRRGKEITAHPKETFLNALHTGDQTFQDLSSGCKASNIPDWS